MSNMDYRNEAALDWCIGQLENMTVTDLSKVIEFIEGGLNIQYITPCRTQFDDLVKIYETAIDILINDKEEALNGITDYYGKPKYWEYKNQLTITNERIQATNRRLHIIKHKQREADHRSKLNEIVTYVKENYPEVFQEVAFNVIMGEDNGSSEQ